MSVSGDSENKRKPLPSEDDNMLCMYGRTVAAEPCCMILQQIMATKLCATMQYHKPYIDSATSDKRRYWWQEVMACLQAAGRRAHQHAILYTSIRVFFTDRLLGPIMPCGCRMVFLVGWSIGIIIIVWLFTASRSSYTFHGMRRWRSTFGIFQRQQDHAGYVYESVRLYLVVAKYLIAAGVMHVATQYPALALAI